MMMHELANPKFIRKAFVFLLEAAMKAWVMITDL
jgi:hypothetical protein